MAGYTRQSTISNGNTINATLFNNEYDQLSDAFDISTGHTHDGSTAGDGPLLSKVGASATTISFSTSYITFSTSGTIRLYMGSDDMYPADDGGVNLGKSTSRFADLYATDINVTGDIDIRETAGKGILVKSPDGSVTKRIGIDNSGNIEVTAV